MKDILREEINSIKSLMELSEDFITVSSGGYSWLNTDNDATASDKLNRALLNDINRAAQSAGVKVTITTGKTGHSKKTKDGNISRHDSNQAVDIAILDGIGADGASNPTNGNPKFRELGDKLVAKLESMGYRRNAEGKANPKAVLWQTNIGGNHFNHIHVSNTTGEPYKGEDLDITPERQKELEKIASTVDGDKPKTSEFAAMMKGIGDIRSTFQGVQKAAATVGASLNEAKGDPYSFKISEKDTDIGSRHEGKIVAPGSIGSSCTNSVVVRFIVNRETYYLEYCGIEDQRKFVGDNVSIGENIGKSNDSVYATYYDFRGKKVSKDTILPSNPKGKNTEPNYKEEPSDDFQSSWTKHFRDEKGSLGDTFSDAFYNLFTNLNPLSSRYAIDPESGKPIKVHQGGLATTRDKNLKPKIKYRERINYSPTKKGAKVKGINKKTPDDLKEEIQQMKKLMK